MVYSDELVRFWSRILDGVHPESRLTGEIPAGGHQGPCELD